ncbi:flavodoxin FldA [Actinobacillus pleuropneumoniae]|nr:flavodoxin FldA [Actinobacillus pleuropneumoniae]
MPTLKEIDFSGKVIGIFGCGDQEDYANISVMRWEPFAMSLSKTAV